MTTVAAAAGSFVLVGVAVWAFAIRDTELPAASETPIPATSAAAATVTQSPPAVVVAPRPEPRADCFPQWCAPGVDGPPDTAPARVAWVLDLIPEFESQGILVGEIREGLFSSMLGLNEEWSAYLWTNFGVVEVVRLPGGLTGNDVAVNEWPEADYTPATSDSGRCPWNYRFAVKDTSPQNVCAASRMFTTAKGPFVLMTRSKEAAARAERALGVVAGP